MRGVLSHEQKQLAFRLRARGWRLVDIAREVDCTAAMVGLMVRAAAAVAAFLCATSAAAQSLAPMQAPGLLGVGPPPVSSEPSDALKEPEDQMRAKGLKDCSVGDRVLARHEGRWISAQVIEVNAAAPYPCKVHLTGRPPTSDTSFSAWMLRPEEARP